MRLHAWPHLRRVLFRHLDIYPQAGDIGDPEQLGTRGLPRIDERADVCVVGAANRDIAGNSRAALLHGDSSPGEIEFSPGGVASNVAENLARMGRPSRRVRLISAVGADDFGRRLITATQASGVDVGLVGVFEDARTATYLALHGPNGMHSTKF